MVKLDDNNFIRWKQHIRLITKGYELTGFLDGTVPVPPRFLTSLEGSLVPNLDASAFLQQYRLLASWLLSTISPPFLSSSTEAHLACDVWTTATCLFAALTGAKLSCLRHELHSLKKGNLRSSMPFSP